MLQSEILELKQHLSSMARQLAEREDDKDSLGAESMQDKGGGEEEEGDSLREIKPGKG